MTSRKSWTARQPVAALLWGYRATRTGLAAPRVAVGRERRVLAVVLAIFMLLAALLTISMVLTGWLFPLRPDVLSDVNGLFAPLDDPEGTWGGPTLAGAWAVHLLVAAAIQAICCALIWWLDKRMEDPPASGIG